MADSQQAATAARSDDAGVNAVERAAAGKSVGTEDERAALDFLLGTPEPAKYTVEADYETPAGMRKLTFHFVAMDGRKIDVIERRHISDKTQELDKISADAELVAEAVTAIEDETGKKTKPTSEEFRTMKPGEAPLASSIDALNARFATQIGLLAGVASAIREAAGWNRDRVGKASRVLVTAAGN